MKFPYSVILNFIDLIQMQNNLNLINPSKASFPRSLEIKLIFRTPNSTDGSANNSVANFTSATDIVGILW